jgi:hypothetical protein
MFTLPFASAPMKLPLTATGPQKICTPMALPGITLRAAAFVPPTVTPGTSSLTPTELPSTDVLLASVPM